MVLRSVQFPFSHGLSKILPTDRSVHFSEGVSARNLANCRNCHHEEWRVERYIRVGFPAVEYWLLSVVNEKRWNV